MKITIEFGRRHRTDVLIDEMPPGYTCHPGWLPSCAENCPHYADEAHQVPILGPEPTRPRWSTRWPC